MHLYREQALGFHQRRNELPGAVFKVSGACAADLKDVVGGGVMLRRRREKGAAKPG